MPQFVHFEIPTFKLNVLIIGSQYQHMMSVGDLVCSLVHIYIQSRPWSFHIDHANIYRLSRNTHLHLQRKTDVDFFPHTSFCSLKRKLVDGAKYKYLCKLFHWAWVHVLQDTGRCNHPQCWYICLLYIRKDLAHTHQYLEYLRNWKSVHSNLCVFNYQDSLVKFLICCR